MADDPGRVVQERSMQIPPGNEIFKSRALEVLPGKCYRDGAHQSNQGLMCSEIYGS